MDPRESKKRQIDSDPTVLMSQTTDIKSNHKGNERFPALSFFFFCCSIKIYWCCSSWLTSACRNALEQESLELLRTFVLYPTLTSDLCGCPHPSILGWNQHWQTYMYVIHVLACSVHGWLLHSIAPGAEVSAKQHVTITDHHLQRKLNWVHDKISYFECIHASFWSLPST